MYAFESTNNNGGLFGVALALLLFGLPTLVAAWLSRLFWPTPWPNLRPRGDEQPSRRADFGLGFYHLFRERSLAEALVGLASGAALVAICFYDAPAASEPSSGDRSNEELPPGTERIAVAAWSLLVLGIGAPVIVSVTDWSPWLLLAPLVPIFGVVTVLQARAERVSPWTVLKRGFNRGD